MRKSVAQARHPADVPKAVADADRSIHEMKSIHILEIQSGNAAHAIRAAAECWGADVTVTWVGNSSQIVDYLSTRPGHDLIVVSGHGDPSGLLLPELHESVKHKYPYDARITPPQFREFVKLNATPVLNLSCDTGHAPFADAFLSSRAEWYIGPVDAPHGSAALMYALEFLYAYLVEHAPVPQAHQTAANHSDDRSMFRIYGIEQDGSSLPSRSRTGG